MDSNERATFADVERLLFEFEATLKKYSISITPESGLNQIGLAILDLQEKRNQPLFQNHSEDLRPYFAGILGVRTFMTKVVALREHPDFHQLVPHLRKLNVGQVPQNSPSGILDQISPKLFELLIALGAMQIGTQLELDDPDGSSGGDNPDVLITVDGVRYGLACKALIGGSTETLIQNLVKGIDQIERSPAEIGFVIVNVKDLINHNLCWPVPQNVDFPEGAVVNAVAWRDLGFVLTYLNDLATKRVFNMERSIGVRAVHEMFHGKRTIPVVVHFLHTATAIASPTGPVPTSVLFLHLYGYGASFISRLNAALQDQYFAAAV